MAFTKVDYEITPRVSKSRRFLVELLELLAISLTCLLLFSTVTINVIEKNDTYQQYDSLKEEARKDLFKIGEESHLAQKYDDSETYLDTYDMYLRYCYKQIHLSYELYKEDFVNNHFETIKDPYNQPVLNKDNDELQYFYTVYAPEKGIVNSDNPLNNYLNNILDLDEYDNVIVFNNERQCLMLNPEKEIKGEKHNFGVLLYTELVEDNKSSAMLMLNKFYKNYYEKADELLSQTSDYQQAYQIYEKNMLGVGQYISFGFIINFLIVALCYYLIMPLIKKEASTPLKHFFQFSLTDNEGEEIKFYKKSIYYFLKTLTSFFSLFFVFYFAYGMIIFTYPFGVIASFKVTPLLFIVISFALWLINELAVYLPINIKENKTALDLAFNIHHADMREFKDGEKND